MEWIVSKKKKKKLSLMVDSRIYWTVYQSAKLWVGIYGNLIHKAIYKQFKKLLEMYINICDIGFYKRKWGV